MSKRALVTLALPVGLAACMDTPTGGGAMQEAAAPNALTVLAPERVRDLGLAIADARARLLPGVVETAGDETALAMAMQRLDERLGAGDPDGVLAAAADAEAALASITGDEAVELGPELDAIRLTLHALRTAARGEQVLLQ
ncbi:MAG TPA: hypothetical protein VFQ45_15260 [Longimicrobium sp.]|nr:hypothetical protein [Longimicrobium sp.]